jgi:Ser/Thr protein kinase RdoA (MazF antagonist)
MGLNGSIEGSNPSFSVFADDAGGGRRGLRAQVSPELLDVLERDYGIVSSRPPVDLGGSSNLNLLVGEGGRKRVVRVYRPSVSEARLSDIQRARRRLAERDFPCQVPIPAPDGRDWTVVDGRVLEVEHYVHHDGHMDTWDRVESGLGVLAAMHDVLRSVPIGADGRTPRFVNYIEAEDVVEATARGSARIRSWWPKAAEAQLADDADGLAVAVGEAQRAIGYASLPRQLVHGDFWDNNVLYRGDELVLIHDFDHMGERARIDDLALTLYYLNSEPVPDVETGRRAQCLRRLVDAYDSRLEVRLTPAERVALPVALARQPLWSVGGWIADLDDDDAARRHAAGMSAAVDLALEIMRDLHRWQEAFLSA